MKKRVLILTLVFMLASTLTACSESGEVRNVMDSEVRNVMDSVVQSVMDSVTQQSGNDEASDVKAQHGEKDEVQSGRNNPSSFASIEINDTFPAKNIELNQATH